MFAKVLTAAALTLVVANPHLGAQSSALPTITVTAFTADRRNEQTQQVGEELSDDLAALLVESGRYRVLARDWMPAPANRSRPLPASTLRQAATKAGVQYIVFGSMRTETIRSVRHPAGSPIALGRRGLLARIVEGTASRADSASSEVICRSVDIELLDAGSGGLIRTMRARGGNGMSPDMSAVADTLARLTATLTGGSR